jgi:hypothetical protein
MDVSNNASSLIAPGRRSVVKQSLLMFALAFSLLTQTGTAQAAPLEATMEENSTIAGIDSNNDGVRDDLEQFIVENFHDDEQLARAMSNLVIAFGHAVIATDVRESRRAHSMLMYASECAVALGMRPAAYQNEILQLNDLMVNTPERKQAYVDHSARIAKLVFAQRIDPKWDEYCAQRVDKLNEGRGWPPRKIEAARTELHGAP